MRTRSLFGFALAALICLAACSKKRDVIEAGPHFEKQLQTALIQARPGAVIELPAGRFDMTGTLSVTADGVTIRGAGMDKTVLNYARQTTGSAGILASGNHFTLEGLTLQDTKGDGVKIHGSDGVVLRAVKAEWTAGPDEKNGSYGIYPVQCSNVLIENSASIGASDAGIYVGQSKNIVVRRSRAEFNVAGIEIENSENADVYENTVTNNAGGLLVFSLPDLPVKTSRATRLYRNEVYSNNTRNFAPKGNIVAKVPTGTGVMVMATHDAEVFSNSIRDNNTVNVSIISYLSTGNPINDAGYDPYVSRVYVHDNHITGGGAAPAGIAAEAIAPKAGTPLPAILWDGIVDARSPGGARICLQNNGGAGFLNYDAAGAFKNVSRDAAPHDCQLPALAAVVLPSAESPAGGAN